MHLYRCDIVVWIVRPETDSPSGAQPPRLSGGRLISKIYLLELYAARRVSVFRRGLLFTQSGARNILKRAARPSREGVFP